MSKIEINKELYKLSPSTLIELFELDTTEIDGNKLPESQQIIRFHNYVSEGYFPVYFNGVKYPPIPIQFKSNEVKGDGTTLPRPRLNVGNADGLVSYYLSQTDGMIGAKLTRKRTFSRFLDGDTWGLPSNQNPFGTPNGEAALFDDVFYVDKLITENKQIVELELASILELHKVKLPRRKMTANNCSNEYRNSTGCDYTGVPQADEGNKTFGPDGYNVTLNDRGLWDIAATYNIGDYVYIESFVKKEDDSGYKRFYYVCMKNGTSGAATRPVISNSWVKDACSRKIGGCLCRFSPDNLPFGGFPALIRVEFE